MTETPALPARFAAAPRAKSHGGLIHTCNGDVLTGLPFGRKNPQDCGRCWEMTEGGAAPRADHADRADRAGRARRDAQDTASRRAHFARGGPHDTGACGPVCTAFDW